MLNPQAALYEDNSPRIEDDLQLSQYQPRHPPPSFCWEDLLSFSVPVGTENVAQYPSWHCGFINFIIHLPVTYVRHPWCNCQRLAKPARTAKDWQKIHKTVRLLRQKDCQGTAEVNDAFKFLPQQLKIKDNFIAQIRTLSVLPIVT